MKFDMSAAWRDATTMLAGNREVLLIIAGIFFFLPSLALAIAMPGVQESMMTDPENAQEIMLSLYASWWWLLLLILLVQIVGYLALLTLLRDHSRPTVGEALKAGIAGLLPAIGTYLLFMVGFSLAIFAVALVAVGSGSAAVAFIVGVIAFVAAVYVCVKLSLTMPVIAIDKVANPFAVLARSWSLTKGNSFRLFLFYLLLAIVYFVIMLVIGMVVGALTVVLGASAALLVNGIVSGLIGAVATVVIVAVIAAVHRQLAGPSPEAVSQTFE